MEMDQNATAYFVTFPVKDFFKRDDIKSKFIVRKNLNKQ